MSYNVYFYYYEPILFMDKTNLDIILVTDKMTKARTHGYFLFLFLFLFLHQESSGSGRYTGPLPSNISSSTVNVIPDSTPILI
jgi:hypothetical protein